MFESTEPDEREESGTEEMAREDRPASGGGIGGQGGEGSGAASATPGDWVLIHVGFALSKVDEDEAFATLKLLQGMGAEYEQELEELKASVIE